MVIGHPHKGAVPVRHHCLVESTQGIRLGVGKKSGQYTAIQKEQFSHDVLFKLFKCNKKEMGCTWQPILFFLLQTFMVLL
jgi:hypothetical protein